MAQEAVNGIRGIRKQKNLPPKEELTLWVKGGFPAEVLPVVRKLAGLGKVETVDSFAAAGGNGVSLMVRTAELFVPLAGLVDADEEIRKIEADLEYQRRFLETVRKKLSNEQFTAHAPAAVVALERKKEQDSLSKIEIYESALKALKNSK